MAASDAIDHVLFAITLVAALGCGLIAGVFFAFSTSVMKALGRLAPGQSIAAMQSINIVILNPWFLGVFLGTGAVCAVAVVSSVWVWGRPGAVYRLVGGTLYLAGSVLVTRVFNVPRNDALASVAPQDARAADVWAGYVGGWTAWNHVRAAASLAAAASFSLALAS